MQPRSVVPVARRHNCIPPLGKYFYLEVTENPIAITGVVYGPMYRLLSNGKNNKLSGSLKIHQVANFQK